jgi:hypothetical protein
MKQINFKLRIRLMSLISFIGSIFLIESIIGIITKNINICIFSLIIYMCFRIIENILWRCPKCKSKLPKGKYTYTISKCSHCNYNLD